MGRIRPARSAAPSGAGHRMLFSRITAKIGWIQEGRTDFSAAGCARITYCLVTTTMWTA